MSDRPADTPAVRPAPPRWARVLSVWYRHALVYSDTFVANATPAVFEPLLLLLAVGFGVGRYVDQDMNGLPYTEFMAAGAIAMTALYTASFESTWGTFVRMRYQHAYQTMLSSPLTLEDVFTGELLWCASKGMLFTGIVSVVLAAFGLFRSPLALLLPVAGFVIAAVFGGLGLLVTSRVRNMNHFQFFFTIVLTPMVFFSGLMFPVQELPAGLRTATYLTPMFHAIETVRLLGWGPAHTSVPWAWACPLVVLACAVVLGRAGVRAMVGRMN